MLRGRSQAETHALIIHCQVPCGRITKVTYNENLARNKLQKNADAKFEDSQPYISELVENIPKYRISGNNYRPVSVGGLDYFYVNI